MKNIFYLLRIIIVIFFTSCFGLQIRNSELDIKKKDEPNGYLKIIIEGDIGYSNPYVRINLTEDYPQVKRRIPLIYSEDQDTVYALEGKLEEKETLIPIKQGDYYASIANEELYTSGAFFIFPLLFQEDKYIGISFGIDMQEEMSNTNKKCITSKEVRTSLVSPHFVSSNILFNRCPKLKIKGNQVTEIRIKFLEEELLVLRSFLRIIPGSILGLPLYGTLAYKSDSTVEIKYPEDVKEIKKIGK